MAEAKNSANAGQAEVQKKRDAELDQGFRGVEVDPTPNENYSLQTPPDAPTPESDPELAAKVGSRKFAGREAK